VTSALLRSQLEASVALTDVGRVPPAQWLTESPREYRARCIRVARAMNQRTEIRAAHAVVEARWRDYCSAIEERDAAFHSCRGMSGPDEYAADAEDAAVTAREELKKAFKAKWALQAKSRNEIYGTEY